MVTAWKPKIFRRHVRPEPNAIGLRKLDGPSGRISNKQALRPSDQLPRVSPDESSNRFAGLGSLAGKVKTRHLFRITAWVQRYRRPAKSKASSSLSPCIHFFVPM